MKPLLHLLARLFPRLCYTHNVSGTTGLVKVHFWRPWCVLVLRHFSRL